MTNKTTTLNLPQEVIAKIAKFDFANANDEFEDDTINLFAEVRDAARTAMRPHVPSETAIQQARFEGKDNTDIRYLADWAEWSKQQLNIDECGGGPGCKVCK